MLNESNVNSYARVFPTILKSAEGDIITDILDKKYIDFFSGAGALNYGHNHPKMKSAIHSFLNNNLVVHCLDMDSRIKQQFLEKFESVILKPRSLNYKIQFTGPTGTNAVEAAVKLARRVTKRKKIIAFTNSFHGMSATSLALSGSREENHKINPSQDVIFFPFENFFKDGTDSMEILRTMILSNGSGIELPAAIILETIQAEGGVNVASSSWLKALRNFTREHNILLIVDDIQVGCGRTGSFFSFERAQIVPDIVLLSKSISGFGLPLSLLLMNPEFDIWEPGEHNGTFRSHNLSLCTATVALDFWKKNDLREKVDQDAKKIKVRLSALLKKSEHVIDIRGLGMIWGIEFAEEQMAENVSKSLFEKGIFIERCGNRGQVIKLLCPLTISKENLETGLDVIADTILNFQLDEMISL
ncbi:diaminobutyrate--2-oxoglutarate transaminase [Spongiimicrobium salis]|uniref:diaminobutyrate--2-oxoglutarate transaminase n=1 Tax=Spongiimicrobium salis TaxID=1667022 RepID=UPI00374DD659